jgi:hypothetical protein
MRLRHVVAGDYVRGVAGFLDKTAEATKVFLVSDRKK